jgi:hypothetical protein
MGGLVKSVGKIFGGGDTPKPAPMVVPEPDPVPTVDDAVAAREKEDSSKRRRGRAALVLTGKDGAGTPNSATKTLLGG